MPSPTHLRHWSRPHALVLTRGRKRRSVGILTRGRRRWQGARGRLASMVRGYDRESQGSTARASPHGRRARIMTTAMRRARRAGCGRRNSGALRRKHMNMGAPRAVLRQTRSVRSKIGIISGLRRRRQTAVPIGTHEVTDGRRTAEPTAISRRSWRRRRGKVRPRRSK